MTAILGSLLLPFSGIITSFYATGIVISSIILMILSQKLFKIKKYIITSREIIQTLASNIHNSCVIYNDKPYDFIFGMWFCGWLYKSDAVLYCTSNRYILLTRLNIKIPEIKNAAKNACELTICYKTQSNSFSKYDYLCRLSKVQKLNSTPVQRHIINIIKNNYYDTGNMGCYFYGSPGTGKSMTGFILAQELKGIYCETYDPLDNDDRMDTLYKNISPTLEKPLILIIEECDSMFRKIKKNTDGITCSNCQFCSSCANLSKVADTASLKSDVYDKRTYNKFMDAFNKGLYPWVILILSSNVPIESINELDSSFLRPGRINLAIDYNKLIKQDEISNKHTEKYYDYLDSFNSNNSEISEETTQILSNSLT